MRQKTSSRLLALLLSVMMIVGMLPMTAFAAIGDIPNGESAIGQVYVSIEDTVPVRSDLTDQSGQPITDPGPFGKLAEGWVDLYPSDSMMSVIARLGISEELNIVGAENGYISSIMGRAEFDRGAGSGWMGTLNDWFTSQGFSDYTVANGMLEDGDVIAVLYTTDFGKDIGNNWGGSDKTVKELEISEGYLLPEFNKDIHEYSLILPANTQSIQVTPTASNKSFQVHTFVGETEYKRMEDIPVSSGTVITVKCGDPSWPTSNTGAANIPAEEYTLRVTQDQSLLSASSLTLQGVNEDGSTAEAIEPDYNADSYEFSADLPSYTQKTEYNVETVTVSLNGLPADVTATLSTQDGTYNTEFVGGKAKTGSLIKPGTYIYIVSVTSGEKTEQYPLVLTKKSAAGLLSKCNFKGTPDFSMMIHGYLEGTLFQEDDEGNLTGKTGLSDSCFHYTVYVSSRIQEIGIAKMADFAVAVSSSAVMYVDGTQWVTGKTQTQMSQQFAKKPVPLTQDETKIEMVWTNRNDPNLEVTYVFTVKRYHFNPQELETEILNLPAVEVLNYETHHMQVSNMMSIYESFTEEEKTQLSSEAVEKLKSAAARMEQIRQEDEQAVAELVELVDSYAGKITEENYLTYYDNVLRSSAIYDTFSRWRQGLFQQEEAFGLMEEAEEQVNRYAILDGNSIGKVTDYRDDFMVSANAFNLTLGAPEDAYEVSFREIWADRPADSPNSSEKGLPYTSPGMLSFEIKDPSIFEIKEVEGEYVDKGLGGGSTYANMKYYLIPKKAGTTTFTVTLSDEMGEYLGQIPEMVVHVNSPEEAAIENLSQKLTDFYSRPNTTKYDTWHYEEGTEGAPFTFHVNGTDAQVYVYEYQQYESDGTAVKTAYTPDENGNVTILIKDGYNPIEVTATYEGQRVTQVYGLKGKVIRYTFRNVSRPGEDFRQGDTISIGVSGLSTPVHKILRIYNPSGSAFQFDTTMPRQGVLKSGGGQYAAGEMEIVLTGSGDITLTGGRVYQIWFGSPLYSETAQGNTGGIAPQTANEFSYLPDIRFHVEENPDYHPSYVETIAQNDGVVEAGSTITLSIPDLNVDLITATYPVSTSGSFSNSTQFQNAYTVFQTDIPEGVAESEVVEGNQSLNALKTVTVTVPADTPAGTYRVYGGVVNVCYGDPTWLKWTDMFQREIGDVEITVVSRNDEEKFSETGKYLADTVKEPTVSSIGGEWAVLALARAGYEVPDGYYSNYYAKVVQALINGDGALPDSQSKSTEYSRVILALTAIGMDITDVNGYNLLTYLTDMDYVTAQGINGPIWALIALDSHGYEILKSPEGAEQVTREKLIAYILEKQLADGGWALSGSTADPDMTGMALQALAPYYDSNSEVKAAVDKALECLSDMQLSNGGFASWGTENAESCAQVIVALTALGFNPAADSRFIKNGQSVLDALYGFYVEGGGFEHMRDSGRNQMATEQGYYALVAYDRFLNDKTSLYDMSDVKIDTNPVVPVPEDKDITLTDVEGTGVTATGKESVLGGLELEANLLTSGELYDKVKEALKDGRFTLYDMYLLKNSYEEVQPDGTITIAIPVPNGYDGAQCKVYRVNTDGSVTEVVAVLKDGKLTFDTDRMGAFAVYQSVKAGTDEPGTTEPPKTGDSTPVALWFTVSLCSLAALVVLGKKKRTVK